jgi:hypothetical protein
MPVRDPADDRWSGLSLSGHVLINMWHCRYLCRDTFPNYSQAAIVWAFTDNKQGQRTSSKSTGSLSVTDFVKFEVAGLKSDTTVRKYRKACCRIRNFRIPCLRLMRKLRNPPVSSS